MQSFEHYYFIEKTIDTNKLKSPEDIKHINDPEDAKCVKAGFDLAQKYGLSLNGWMENSYYFTIPAGVEGEKNTFAARNEKELVQKLKKYQPTTFKEPVGPISDEISSGCDYVDINTPEGKAELMKRFREDM